MRAIITVLLLLACCGGVHGSSVTFVDDFNAPAPGDVIGNTFQADIQSLFFPIGADTLSGTILTTYGNSTLSPFWMGSIPMNIGNMIPTLNNPWMFGIPLQPPPGSNDLLAAGHPYWITQPVGGLLLASDVPNSPAGFSYRPDEPVRIDNAAAVVDFGAGGVGVMPVAGSDGVTSALYEIAATVPDPAGSIEHGDTFTVQLASSTGANGVIRGPGTVAPEPASMVLTGSALLALGLSRRSRFWRACAKLKIQRS